MEPARPPATAGALAAEDDAARVMIVPLVPVTPVVVPAVPVLLVVVMMKVTIADDDDRRVPRPVGIAGVIAVAVVRVAVAIAARDVRLGGIVVSRRRGGSLSDILRRRVGGS